MGTLTSIFRGLAILVLRAVMLIVLVGAGWLIYQRMPAGSSDKNPVKGSTTLVIVLRQASDVTPAALDIPVELYPVDIVAVRHEFFTEPRAGKRFEDFLADRMRGRKPVSARLDKEGHGTVVLPAGNWWLNAKLSGDEDLEWRLPVSVVAPKQTVELTSQNAYTRSKTF